jgi:hypothetical protein
MEARIVLYLCATRYTKKPNYYSNSSWGIISQTLQWKP